MAETPRKRQPSPDRREAIIEKAAELLARNGVSATTVREIGDAVGILSGSLYHHFKSKDEIVNAIMSAYLDDLVARYDAVLATPADATAKLRSLIHASLETVEAHPHATEIYQSNASYLLHTPGFEHVREAAARVRQAWMTTLDDGVREGVIRDDLPTKVIYPLLRDGLWLTVRWFKPTAAYDRLALAEDCYRMFLEGIAAPQRAADRPAALAAGGGAALS